MTSSLSITDSCSSVSSSEDISADEQQVEPVAEEELSEADRVTDLFNRLLAKTQDELNNLELLDLSNVLRNKASLVYALCLREIRLFKPEQLKAVLPKMAGLVFLDFACPPQLEEEPDLQKPLAKDWPDVEVNAFLRILKEKCLQLQSVDLSFVKELSVSDLIDLSMQNPSLRELNLVNCLTLRDEHLKELSETLQELETLDLSLCLEVGGEGVVDLVTANPNLRCLALAGMGHLSEECLLDIAGNCTQLNRVDLREIPTVSEAVCQTFFIRNEELGEDNFLWGLRENEVEEASDEEEVQSEPEEPSTSDEDTSDYDSGYEEDY